MQYLFIDGAHLRVAYDQIISEFYGEPGRIDYRSLLRTTSSEKAFLYDCIDDVKRKDESDAEFHERVRQQEAEFARIQALPYYHVKLGQLSGAGKKKRQKKVDILLAVDMLSFAHSRVIDGAALIAGDLDFVPVVDELVRGGTRVHVFYNPRGASKDLYTAADVSHPMNIHFMREASPSSSRKRRHGEEV
jgi:uncharacterized LabA/DUF88 family protein